MAYDDDLNFVYDSPTSVIFGKGTVRDAGFQVDALGGKRVLLVTDKDLVKFGIAEKVLDALGKRCVGVFDEVIPDTGVHIVEKGAEYGRSVEADTVVSIGGGSPIDTGKGIAVLLKEGGRLADHAGLNNLTRPQTPHVVIPTTAGTGSESTYAAVIKDHEEKQKIFLVDRYIIPNVGILDPELTLGMPARLTGATGMDAFCHAIEAIHSMQAEPIADALALHAIRMITEFLPRTIADGGDIVARGQMLIAANIAGTAFSNAQVGVVHALAHSVGARFGVAHGIANAILLPHCMRFNNDTCPDRYALVAQAMGLDVRGKSDDEAGEAAADAVQALNKEIGLPPRLRDEGVPEDGLAELADLALEDGSIVYNPKFAMDPDLLLEILEQAW